MEKLRELERDFDEANLSLEVRGLDTHKQLSEHDLAARKRAMTRLRRITVVAPQYLEIQLCSKFVELGASGFTATACYGAGRATREGGGVRENSQFRVETVVTQDVADEILDYLRIDVYPNHKITACAEAVDVLRPDQF